MALSMKLNAALAKSLLMAASIGMVVPVYSQTPAQKAAQEKAKQPAKPAPGKAARPPEKDAEPEPQINGIAVPREKGGFIGISVENSNFKVRFYDDKKKPIAADVARASLRWTSTKRKGDEYMVLTPSEDGKSLTSDRVVPAPYSFRLFLRLLQADESLTPEVYTVVMSPEVLEVREPAAGTP
jgi:hypothetical protein